MLMFIKWLIILAVVILILGFFLLVCMDNYLLVDHELAKSDAIVVMMGDALGRVPEAVDVYMAGYAPTVIMVQGAHPTETSEAENDAINLGIPEENIIVLPGQATNTWEEAEIVRDYLAQRTGINSLIIVNSRLQTRRTLISYQTVRAAWIEILT